MDKKVYLIGKKPPPIGGVTVHANRLYEHLLNEKVEVTFLDLNKLSFLSIIMRIIKSPFGSIVHTQMSNFPAIFLISLTGALSYKKVVVTFHSFRNKTRLSKVLAWMISIFSKKIIAVGGGVKKELTNININEKKITVINSFIPPTNKEVMKLQTPFKYEEIFKNSSYKIAVNASMLKIENGKDLYGIKESIAVLERFLKLGKDVRLYICLGQIGDESYSQEINNYIKKAELSNRVYFIVGEDLLFVLKRIDLFLRPTTSDSFGVSIAEALFLKKVAVASDVCERPKGTITYTSGKFEELWEKCLTALDKKQALPRQDINDHYLSYKRTLEVYRQV